MAMLRGDLSVMPLTDLLQWIDLSKKTGTVRLLLGDVEKKIYFDKGLIIFVSSAKEGERLGEYLHSGSHLEAGKIRSALQQSQAMKVPFTRRLVDLGYFSEEQLREIILVHAKEILFDAIRRTEGAFEFIQDEVPSYVFRGTISLNATRLTFHLIEETDVLGPRTEEDAQ